MLGIDSQIYGCAHEDDPLDGPARPMAGLPAGITLFRYEGEFSREGRGDTEAAYLRDGSIEWSETQSLDALKAHAIQGIDLAGEALRLTVINRMTTQTEEYRRVEAQARAWRDAGYPEGEEGAGAPRGVRGWAMAKWREGWTNRQACDDILATADGWFEILDTIRDLRLMNKEDVRHAQDSDAIRAICADMEADMGSMAAQMQLPTATE